ncbi:MAG: carbohydrate-binding protein [Gammaproteobacteria bacterium]|nr:carbohydrate-binding protein [Gammaproteobacteria bacterium]
MFRPAKIRLISLSSILFLVGTLTACGGGDDSASGENHETGVILGSTNGENDSNGQTGTATIQGVSRSDSQITISGSIVDGPVIGAAITIRDAGGQELAKVYSDYQARYSANIPAGTAFPVTISSSGGTDLVTNAEPTFNMVSTVMSTQETTANINPFSTLIVKTAQKMPSGLTPANLVTANRNILAGFNAGLDTKKMPNPITTPVTEQNVATVVKSSEVLAEIIRRNYSALSSVNSEVTQNTLIESLAADMTDGVLDGKGASGADTTVSATATVASGQVLIEALSNNLQVNNAPATSQLDDSIKAIMPTATETTGELPVNMEILQNVQTALAVAAVIAPSAGLADIQTSITTIEVGSTAQEIAINLAAANNTSLLDDAMSEILNPANTEETAVVEQVISSIPVGPATDSAQRAYGGTPWTVPGLIEAEFYDEGGDGVAYSDTTLGNAGGYLRSDNVDIWVSTDTGGGYMVGTTKTGEWLEYTVNVVNTGAYVINLRVASAEDGKLARVLLDGSDLTGSIAVPNTGGWQTWQTVGKSVNLGSGLHVLRVQVDNGSFNLNSIKITADSSSGQTNGTQTTPVVVIDPLQKPHGGTPWTVPGLIEAEYYDEGGDGVAYSDTTNGNSGGYLRSDNVDIWVSTDIGGGYMVGTTQAGEWLEYTVNVTTTGTYTINLRVATADSGKLARILVDGSDLTGAIAIPNTGGWQTWQTVRKSVNLSAGLHVLRMQVDNGSFNLNSIEILSGNIDDQADVTNTTLTLTWSPNSDSIQGYIVYFGPSENAVTTETTNIQAFAGSFDPVNPAIQYDSWYDLGMKPGDNICFKLRAYNADGISDWSMPACTMVPLTI